MFSNILNQSYAHRGESSMAKINHPFCTVENGRSVYIFTYRKRKFLRLQVAIELNYHLDLNCRGIYKNHDPPPWSWEIREDVVLLLPGKNKNLTSTFLNPLSWYLLSKTSINFTISKNMTIQKKISLRANAPNISG